MKTTFLLLYLSFIITAQAAPDLFDRGSSSHSLSATSIASGSTFTFSTKIGNLGMNVENVAVSYHLSTDQIAGNADDILLSSVVLPKITSDEDTDNEVTLTMPFRRPNPGPYWLVWTFPVADDSDPKNNNGIFLGSQITATFPSFDFDLRDGFTTFHSLSSLIREPGDPLRVRFQVCNEGPQLSTGFTIKYRMIEVGGVLGIGSVSDEILAEIPYDPIAAPIRGASCRAVDEILTIPDLEDGFYHFGYSIEAPLDSRQNNNVVEFTEIIQIGNPTNGPNLRPTNVFIGFNVIGISPLEPINGENISILGTVSNIGNQTSEPYVVRHIASIDTILGNSDDIELGSESYGGLPREQSDPFVDSVPTTALATNQAYRIFTLIETGADVDFSNNSHHNGNTLLIPRSSPDLIMGDDWSFTGQKFDYPESCYIFRGTIRNASGAADTRARFESFFAGASISDNGPQDFRGRLTLLTVDGVPTDENEIFLAGNGVPVEIVAIVQAQDVLNEIGASLDGDLYTPRVNAIACGLTALDVPCFDVTEADITNNSAIFPQQQISSNWTKPDLKVDADPGVDEVLSPVFLQPFTDSLTVRVAIENPGGIQSPPSQIAIFIGDTEIGEPFDAPSILSGRTLANGGHRSVTATIPIPAGFPTGFYQVHAVIDPENTICELSECNNETLLGAVYIGNKADLAETTGHRVFPDAINAGESFDFNFRLVNRGFIPTTGGEKIRYYLSENKRYNPNVDLILGTRAAPAMGHLLGPVNPPIFRDISMAFTIQPWVDQGSYHLIAVIDADDELDEGDETNNIVITGRRIFVGPAINLKPGLTEFEVSNNRPPAGSSITLTGSWTNGGSFVAGAHEHSIELIRDNLTIGGTRPNVGGLNLDPALETFTVGTADPSEEFSVNREINIPANTEPGKYTLIYRLDRTNLVNELREGDNTASVSITVLPQLPEDGVRIIRFQKNKNNVFVRWTSDPRYLYQLQSNTDLRGWKDYNDTPLPATDLTTQFNFRDDRIDLTPGGELPLKAFFRIVRMKP